MVSTVAGNRTRHGTTDGDLSVASFDYPEGIAVDKNGIIYVSEYYANKIRKIEGNIVSTFVGSETGGDLDGTGTAARIRIGTDSKGNIVVADQDNHAIRFISKKGWVSTLGGVSNDVGFIDGTGSAARFCLPVNVNFAPNGDVWVVDGCEGRIRKIILQ